ncbi:MAG TPA: hypothetical protein VFB38_04015 [Chthonomonadaceae bacterium]|nr:hypothetical protein [Chthonomonadaceae bacterium]
MATISFPSVERQQRAEALRQMRQRLYNPQAAEEARRSAHATPNRFDAQAYLEYVTDHPVFSKLHLISEDDE